MTITSYPGERATLKGRLRVADSANFVTVESLDLDGRDASNLPSPSVYGDDVVFRDNDVTDYHTGICFLLGSDQYGRAKRTTIERNRIHDCGILPAQNHHHGIYIEASDDARVLGNWIYDNADRGVQMFPDSQGSYISGNVIDGNGQGVSYARESANNVVEHNVVSNSVLRWNIEDWELSGAGNVARNNCVWTTRTDLYNRQGGIMVNPDFTSVGNLIADPLFVDRGAKDFRLRDGSPCAALLAGGGTPPPPRPARARPAAAARARSGAGARPRARAGAGRRLPAQGEGEVAAPGEALHAQPQDRGGGRRRRADRSGGPVRGQQAGGPRHARSLPGDVDRPEAALLRVALGHGPGVRQRGPVGRALRRCDAGQEKR